MTAAKPFLTCFLLTQFFFSTGLAQSPGKYTDYDRGYNYYYYEKWDSAFLMFNRYINNADDSLNKGKALLYMGDMQSNIGDLYGSQESLLNSIKVLNPANSTHSAFIGYVYNSLGNASLNLKLYDEAIHFYNQAYPFFKRDAFLYEVMNGKATAFQKKREYQEAIAIYDSILSVKPIDQTLVARVIDNRARTKWLQDPGYPALAELHAALKIRTDSQYNLGLNASYAHLADYHAKSKKDSALWYAGKMLDKARVNQSSEDMLEAMDKLILFNRNPAIKEQWFTAYKKLNDSLQLSRDTTRNRFALIRYDVQKSKADNLVLQQHITKQQIWIYGLIVLAVITITAIYSWYSRRRKRIQLESENAIRNDRLKTSQKVHDVVANGLYGIMNELEHNPIVDREPIISRIEDLYEKSRNISYEDISYTSAPNYDRQVHELLTAFASEHTKVIIVGNQQSFWNRLTQHQTQEIHLVLNELMVNMKKHSQAKNVSVIFREENNTALIIYKDDGIGFKPGQQYGHGLHSTVNRINSQGGAINFGKNGQAGLSVEIRIPLNPATHD